MILREALSAYLNQLLCCDRFNDYAPNGIQVEGAAQIRRICTAVTASEEVISQAIAFHADALLVHHGYFWRGEPAVITGMKRQRLNQLLRNDINLLAYHLPLDCHPDLGNNACLGRLFDASSIQMHRAGGTENLLWSGSLPQSISSSDFEYFILNKLSRPPLAILGHDRPITRIAWCSGGAQDFIEEASRLGVDAYLSGEISERTYYQSKELGICYYACGHHATERYGIQALGQHLQDTFKVHHLFLDSHNPV